VSRITHQICSNTLTVVSLARAVTRLTTSTRMEDRRKRDTISSEHCCTEGHPAWEKYCRTKYQAAPEPNPTRLGSGEGYGSPVVGLLPRADQVLALPGTEAGRAGEEEGG